MSSSDSTMCCRAMLSYCYCLMYFKHYRSKKCLLVKQGVLTALPFPRFKFAGKFLNDRNMYPFNNNHNVSIWSKQNNSSKKSELLQQIAGQLSTQDLGHYLLISHSYDLNSVTTFTLFFRLKQYIISFLTNQES